MSKSSTGTTPTRPAPPGAQGRRLLLPLAAIFGAIVCLQLLSLKARSLASALEHEGRITLSVSASQRLVVEQYERSSYLAVVGLATDNWPLLIDQRHRASELAKTFEETARALAYGGKVRVGDERVELKGGQDPRLRALFEQAQRLWGEATASQVRMLRSGNHELKNNSELDSFRLRTAELAGVLERAHALLTAEAEADRHRGKQIEAALPAAGAAMIVLLAAFVYLRMLRPLVTTTGRLSEMNRDMRLVLENIEGGLVTVDRARRASKERSASLEAWLGPVPESGVFSDLLRKHSPETARWFDVALESLFEGELPPEVALEQMPKTVVAAGRTLRFRYRVIESKAGEVDRLLVVLDDVTADLERQRIEAEQRELITIFQQIANDRPGFEDFLEESGSAVASLCGPGPIDEAIEARLLHTLKGNCAMFGFLGVSEACHDVESALADEERPMDDAEKQRLRECWLRAAERGRTLLGSAARDVLEIEPEEHRGLLELARQKGAHAEVVSALESWAGEPVRRRFERFAEQARVLSQRLGKPPVEVQVEARGVRLNVGMWSEFWAAFTHVVRNAVDHGIEAPEARKQRGKPPAGRLWLGARYAEGGLRIVIRDDGGGIPWGRVAKRAAELGLPHESREQLTRALFHRGFSTKEEVTTVSGRGVGLDALHHATEQFEGSIVIHSEQGQGTEFEFLFPRA